MVNHVQVRSSLSRLLLLPNAFCLHELFFCMCLAYFSTASCHLNTCVSPPPQPPLTAHALLLPRVGASPSITWLCQVVMLLTILLRLTGRHFPRTLQPRENMKKKKVQKACHVCSHTTRRQKKRSDTLYYCHECDVALCIEPCFEDYHTLLHY